MTSPPQAPSTAPSRAAAVVVIYVYKYLYLYIIMVDDVDGVGNDVDGDEVLRGCYYLWC